MTTLNVIRKREKKVRSGQFLMIDYWLALAIAGLIVVGMLMVYSTTFDNGLDQFKRQMASLIAGVFGALLLMRLDYRFLRRWSVWIMVAALISLVAVLFVGEKILGARRGLFGGSIQPAEFAKLATLLYISHWLSSKGERVKALTYGLVPFAIIVGVVAALIVLQPDLSTAILIVTVSLCLFFVAGADLRQFAIAGLLGSAIFFILVTTLPHAADRIESFKVALLDPTQAGWQVQQAVLALATGGIFGVGLGQSTQKFGSLPFAHTDGVFAILGEELGLVGCLLYITLMAIVIWRGVRAALRARDGYGSLLGIGIITWIGIQALINMAVITAVLPFTGMPLPFLSYGGSSIFITLLGMGVLLSISRDASTNIKSQRRQSNKETYSEDINLRRRNRRSHISGASGR